MVSTRDAYLHHHAFACHSHLPVADAAACFHRLSSDTGLESSHLLAPVKIKSEEIDLLAATSMDTKGSDTSGGSFSTLSPYSGIHVPELDMYSAPVVFGGGLSFLPASAPGSVIADSECRLQGAKSFWPLTLQCLLYSVPAVLAFH
jgi:hypothetical protein